MSAKQSFFQHKKTAWQKFFWFSCLILLALHTTANVPSNIYPEEKATLYIIGDSTVKNGQGKGGDGLWGWGHFIAEYFDPTKLQIRNHAIGGRSSRTFITEGRWDRVLDSLKEGDFVLIQFGHNDGGPMDTGRARASIKGNGDETKEVTMEATGKNEIVHSYGWYLRKYIEDSKAKGAIPIVLSPVPRNIWKDNKVARASNDYGKWASEAAKEGGAYFVDLNEIVASHYEQAGEEKVKTAYFLTDHTHTTKIGAKLNAASVIEGIIALEKCHLKDYLVSNVEKKLLK